MSFTSLGYFPFLAVTAFLFRFLPEKFHTGYLLVISWWIYFMYGWQHFLILVMITVFTYLTGWGIEKTGRQDRKKWLTAAAVFGMAGLLFYAKHSGIMFGSKVIVPVGISFYLFQAMSYLMDVYHGEAAEHSFVRYALYLSFFPQVVAGPIEQADHLLPQFGREKVTGEDRREAVTCLLSGCVRKFVIADGVAETVDRVYGNINGESGAALAMATVLFAIQIYGDFSGYTHIAIGSARLFGIRLTENFNRPYLATGCRDFWKRWHITLTQWLTRYVYIPLGGKQNKCRNILIVFFISGLWHGTDLTFLCWGAYFGIWRIAEEFVQKYKKPRKNIRTESVIEITVKRAATFLGVCVSWIFFRSRNMAEACEVFRKIVLLQNGSTRGIGAAEFLEAVVLIVLLGMLPVILRKQEDEKKRYYRNTVLVVLIVVSMLCHFANGADSSFIYFQF